MSCLSVLADRLLGSFVDFTFQKVGHHVAYIFRYKKKMKELEKETSKLENKIRKNKGKAEQAEKQGEIVVDDVEVWVEKAEEIKHGIEELVDVNVGHENMKCLKFSCPNLISRYLISKEVQRRIKNLKEHIRIGDFEVVAHRAPYPEELQFTASGDFVHFNSRKSVMKMINDSLVTPSVNMIGVCGAGGIGKTTTVEEVGKNARKYGLFDEVVVAVVSQDVNVRKIQGLMADRLNLTLKSETEAGRAGELLNRLNNGKNNLVILDDLWKDLDFRAIGIPLREENKGCKVILTTRNCDVLRKMKVDECIVVEVLSKNESWVLFEKKVGVTFPSVELRSLAKSVCKECGGLPVAILAVGGALAGKEDERFWREALDQLRNSSWGNIDGIDPKMNASLRLSYDYLEKEAKSVMLLCCLYPEDDDIPVNFLLFHFIGRRMLDPNKNTMEKARDRIFTLISSLKTRCLLLDGIYGDSVKIHDVIRDVVLSIAKSDEHYLFKDVTDEWPSEIINENLVALSIRLNKLKEFPNELVCPRLHTLRIECLDSSFQFLDNFFSGIRELIILELKGINMLCSPSSLANLSELRTLILINCQLEDMSFLRGLKSNLKVLVIENSYIKALPTELGEVSGLRVLLLNGSDDLELIPAGVISKLIHLEELRLPRGFSFCEDVEINRATLSELSSLTRLTSLRVLIPDITNIPDLNLEKMVNYEIAVGERIQKYERYQHRSKYLKLAGIAFDDKLGSLIETAKVLYLIKVEGLKNVLHDRERNRFLELEALVIDRIHDCDHLLGAPNSFSKLTSLSVRDCNFEFLFTSSSAKGLPQLRELYIRNCKMLEEIVGTEEGKDEQDQFSSKIKELWLWNLPKLISFYPKVEKVATSKGVSLPKGQPLFNEKVTFLALEGLRIVDLPNITEIWDKQVLPTKSFPQLNNVSVFCCEQLVNVFPSDLWAQSQNLTILEVESCKGVEVIVSSIGIEESEAANKYFNIFPRLRSVGLCNLENLKTFYGNSTRSEPQSLLYPQIQFPALGDLTLEDLPNIDTFAQQLSKGEVKFPAIRELEIDSKKWYTRGKPNIEYLGQQLLE